MACMQGRGGLLLLIAFLVMYKYVQSFWDIAEQEVSFIHSFCEEECTGMPHTGENGCISYSMDTQVPGFWTHKLYIKLVEMDRFVAFVNFVPGIIMISVTTALLKEPISHKFTGKEQNMKQPGRKKNSHCNRATQPWKLILYENQQIKNNNKKKNKSHRPV